MTDLRIRITESDGIRYATGVNPYASTLYVGENIPEALDAILEGLQSFRDIPAMVRALHFCPEFCQLAAAVHGLHLAEKPDYNPPSLEDLIREIVEQTIARGL